MSAETAVTPFLQYHCPKLRSSHLRSPCDGNVAKAAELRQKFPNALLGPMEKCLECQGQGLEVRENPVIPPDEKNGARIPRSCVEATPLDEKKSEENLNDIPFTKKEAVMEYTGDIRPEMTCRPQFVFSPMPEAPRCPKHPDELQVACGETSKRAGQYLGACKVCMTERKLGKKPGKVKGKMTRAAARDYGLAPKKSSMPPVRQNDPEPAEINILGQNPSSPLRCKAHNLPIKFNAKGISMGGCEECRREIAAMGGHKAKILLAQNPLERIFADHGAELEWLRSHANQQVRTPEGQLVFLIRMAMGRFHGQIQALNAD